MQSIQFSHAANPPIDETKPERDVDFTYTDKVEPRPRQAPTSPVR